MYEISRDSDTDASESDENLNFFSGGITICSVQIVILIWRELKACFLVLNILDYTYLLVDS